MSLELSYAKDFINWISRKIELNHLSANATSRRVHRGDVYWCEFGLNVGSEMSKTTPRPAIIIQNDKGNMHSPNTIVIPITHKAGTGPFLIPIHTQLNSDGSLLLDGKANTSNIICASKARLLGRITKLPDRDMRSIEDSIIMMLGLKHRFDSISKKYDLCQAKLKSVEDELYRIKNAS